jgi:transcriptional regulator with XRE-family HTH domain
MRGADLIREARRRAGLTQAELAARVGTTQSAIARLERGAEPSVRRVAELVRACGLELRVSLAPIVPPSPPPDRPDLGALRLLAGTGATFVVIGVVAAALRGVAVTASTPTITPAVGLESLERFASGLDALGARLRTPGGTGSLPFDRSIDGLRAGPRWELVTFEGELDLDVMPAGTAGYRDLHRDADRIEGLEVASLADIARHLDAEGADPAIVATVRAHLG